MLEKRICPVCKKEYETQHWNKKKTCSKACGVKHKSKKIKCVCAYCGKEMMRSPSLTSAKQYFCSYKCAGLSRRIRKELVCQNCGTIFKKPQSMAEKRPPKYCSRICYTVARHRAKVLKK